VSTPETKYTLENLVKTSADTYEMTVDDTNVQPYPGNLFAKHYRITVLGDDIVRIEETSGLSGSVGRLFGGEERHRTFKPKTSGDDSPPPIDMSGYRTTHTVLENLRLRDNPDTAGKLVTTLEKDTQVQVIETGKNATIDGITAPWVKVLSNTGYSGWCFSGYLQAITRPVSPVNRKVWRR
jgi:hypothetical protein